MSILTPNRLDGILQWGATALTLLGAVLTSAAIDPYNVWCFNFGTGLWLVWSIRMRIPSLIAVNGGLGIIYVGGTIRSLLY
jgi:hypothetical protein